MLVSLRTEAQNVYTAYIDSSDIIPSWPPSNDSLFTVTNGDYFYLINKVYPIFFNFWIDDPNLLSPPPFSSLTVQTLDTIIGFHFLNDSTFERLYGSVVYDTITGFQNISVFTGDGNYGQRFFLTYILGFENNEKSIGVEKISLFPNPTDGRFYVYLSGIPINSTFKIKADVIDNTGKIITQIYGNNFQNLFNVDISSSPSGIYILRVIIDNRDYECVKIVKE